MYVICGFSMPVFVGGLSVYCLHAGIQTENHWWELLLDNELSSPPVGAKQPEGSEQSSHNNSQVYSAVDNKCSPSWKRAAHLIKMYIMTVQNDDSFHATTGTNTYKAVTGTPFSATDSLFMSKNVMGCSKMLISSIGCYDRPFWPFNGPHIHSVGAREGASWLVSVVQCSFTGDVSPAMASSVREFAQSFCAVGATHQDTESALFHISEEEEQENDGTEES